jgi:predicted membrane protein
MTEQNENKNEYRHRDGKIVTGVFFLIIGALLLANKMGAGIPDWFFSWPSILIIVGLYVGVKHRFEHFGWLIMVIVGSLFLINNEFVDLNLRDYALPIVFLALGIAFITRPKHKWHGPDHWKRREEWKKKWDEKWKNGVYSGTAEADVINTTDGEFIEVNSVFGSAKKNIFSKNFKGGEINCFMGGAEIDLTQADIQGPVIIEANQVFGGTKLVIPPHWDIKMEVTSVFGGIEDKRKAIATQVDVNKVLILKGTNIFGGMEIKSY